MEQSKILKSKVKPFPRRKNQKKGKAPREKNAPGGWGGGGFFLAPPKKFQKKGPQRGRRRLASGMSMHYTLERQNGGLGGEEEGRQRGTTAPPRRCRCRKMPLPTPSGALPPGQSTDERGAEEVNKVAVLGGGPAGAMAAATLAAGGVETVLLTKSWPWENRAAAA